jgi:hypothetical protein
MSAAANESYPSSFPSFSNGPSPCVFMSSSTPFHSGVRVWAILVFRLLSILKTWPIHCHLLFQTLRLIYSSSFPYFQVGYLFRPVYL